MSYFEESVEVVSIVSGQDFTLENTSRFVSLTDAGRAVRAAAGVAPFGVMTTAQPEDAAGRVVFAGTVPVEAGGAIAVGDGITVGAEGVAISGGASPIGVARTSAATGGVAAIQLYLTVPAVAEEDDEG